MSESIYQLARELGAEVVKAGFDRVRAAKPVDKRHIGGRPVADGERPARPRPLEVEDAPRRGWALGTIDGRRFEEE